MLMYAFAVSASVRLRCPFVLSYDGKEFELPEYFSCRRFSAMRNGCFSVLYRAFRPWLPGRTGIPRKPQRPNWPA